MKHHIPGYCVLFNTAPFESAHRTFLLDLDNLVEPSFQFQQIPFPSELIATKSEEKNK